MVDINQDVYTVEFVCPIYNVVYYRDINASIFEDAKIQIRNMHPDVFIRAVTLRERHTEKTRKNPPETTAGLDV